MIKLKRGSQELLLGPEFVLDYYDLNQLGEGMAIPGYDGEVPPLDSNLNLENRKLTLRGNNFFRTSRTVRSQYLNTFLTFLLNRGSSSGPRFELYPDSAEEWRFTKVRMSSFRDVPVKDLSGLVGNIQVDCIASNPFLVGALQTQAVTIVNSGQTFIITNPGTIPCMAEIQISVTNGLGTIINPTLSHNTYGRVYSLTGSLIDTNILILSTEQTAYRDNTAVLSGMSIDFVQHGVELLPGDNLFTYSDDFASSHSCGITVRFEPQKVF